MAIASINADGWSGEWTGGTPPTFTPDSSPVTLALTRQGFDATGAATSFADSVVLTKRVRQAYPNQASLSASRVALSDYVYSTDTIVSVTNNSTEASPKPVAHWLQQDRQIVGNTISGEIEALHRNARDWKPVACVIVTATDGTTTVSQTVSAMTISVSPGDACPVLVYAYSLDITSLANTADITVNAKVYPWVGGAGSVLDSAAGAVDGDGFVPQRFRKDTARFASPHYVYVDPAAANDTAGVASTNAATAAASPVKTIGGAWVKLRAAIGSAYADGSRIRLKTGTHVFGDGGAYNTYQTGSEVVIERDPASASRAAVILQFGAANVSYDDMKWFLIQDMTVSRMGNFALRSAGATGRVSLRDVILDCASVGFALSNGRVAMLGGITLLNAEGSNAFLASGSQKIMLFRGVTGGGSGGSFSVEGFNVVGCNLTNVVFSWVNARLSGSIVAYNKLNKCATEVWTPNGPAITGIAFVQNVVEWTAAAASPAFGPSRDATTGDISHLIAWHNTFVGANIAGRGNILYDDGPNGNLRTHKLQSFVGNIHVQINTKNDWFAGANGGLADASSRIGNWPYANGVGCRGEVSQFVDAGPDLPQFRQDYPGLKASIGTSSTVRNDPSFVNYKGVTYNGSAYTAGAGGGDYHLTGATSSAYGRMAGMQGVLPFDLSGLARRADAYASAGAYESTFSPPITGGGGGAIGGIGGGGTGTVPVQGGGGGSVGGIGGTGSGGPTPITGTGGGSIGGIGGDGAGDVTDPPITETGVILATAERTIVPVMAPTGGSVSASLPFVAVSWLAPFDPADRTPYAIDWSKMIGTGETITEISRIKMSAAGASLGLMVDGEAGRRPVISVDGKKTQVWFVCDPAFQDNPAFAGAGVQVGLSVKVLTSTDPYQRLERTGVLTVRQQ